MKGGEVRGALTLEFLSTGGDLEFTVGEGDDFGFLVKTHVSNLVFFNILVLEEDNSVSGLTDEFGATALLVHVKLGNIFASDDAVDKFGMINTYFHTLFNPSRHYLILTERHEWE